MLTQVNTNLRISDSQYHNSVYFMLLSTLCVAFVGLLAKEATTIFGLNSAIILRFTIPLVILVAILRLIKYKISWSMQLKLHFFRAILVTAGQYCLFYYLSKGSLVNGALLVNTAPFFITLNVMYSERRMPKKYSLLSLTIGFVGIIWVLQPGTGLLQPLSIIGLLSGLLTACSQVINHKISKTENDIMISLHLYLFCSIISVTAVLATIATGALSLNNLISLPPSPQLWLMWLLFACISFASQIFRSKAYIRVKNASVLAPLLFTTVLFASIFDLSLYNKLPDLNSIIGGSLIFLSSIIIYIIWKKLVLRIQK